MPTLCIASKRLSVPPSRALASLCRIALSGALAGVALPAVANGNVLYEREAFDESLDTEVTGDSRVIAQSSATPGIAFLDARSSIGVGAGVGPRYPGARKFGAGPLLLGSIRKGHFFLDSLRGVGVDMTTQSGVYGSVAIDYTPPSFFTREGTGGRRINGSRYGALARTPGSAVFTAHLAQNFSTGTTIFVEAEFAPRWGKRYSAGVAQTVVDTDRLSVSMQGTMDWSDARMNRTFFGINAPQQSQSGWAQYNPGAGLSRYSLSLMAQYKVSQHWSLLGFAELSRLPSRVAKAPFVARPTSIAVGAAVQYTW